MLRIKNLTKAINDDPLLDSINFTLNKGKKVALIGPNGSGKTTLLKLIMGEVPYDLGQIIVDQEKLGYLPQTFDFHESLTVDTFFEQLTVNKPKWQGEKVLSQLGINDLSGKEFVQTMSEGQKMKFKLAQILMDDPTLLLLDEPTNHLDITGILWFEGFVKTFKGSTLMISHDRAFLDNTIDQVFEIDERQLHVFDGNYTRYKEQKEGWVEKREERYKKQEQKRKQMEQLLGKARSIKGGQARGKAVRAAKKRMEREVTKNEISEYTEHGGHTFNLEGTTHTHKLMLRLEDLSKKYDQEWVFKRISMDLRGRERVWLYGPNGAGKSTILNIITGNLAPTSGICEVGENVKWGYFQQNQKHLPLDVRVDQYLADERNITGHAQYGFMSKLNFPKEYLERALGQLSPGERARLSFGLFTQGEYNLLILDEPTNHLDVWTKEAIEEALQQYEGAILLVSHDRYFVENVGVGRVLNLEEGRLSLI